MKPRKIGYAALLASVLAIAIPAGQAGAVRLPNHLDSTSAKKSAHIRSTPAGSANSTGVTGGTMFGGTLPLVAEQRILGRKLAIVRMYYYLGQNFSTRRSRSVMAAGSTVLASLDVSPTRGPSYASIAAGRADKQILAWLSQANQDAGTYNLPAVYVAFQHEANDPAKQRLGSPAQFVAAWRHIHALAAQAHLNAGNGGRLRWALILEHLAYFAVNQRPHWSLRLGMAQNYWPGGSNVNVVAADGYDRGGCRTHSGTSRPTQPSVSPGSVFDPVLTWARAHGGLPVFLAEWASASYTAVPAWQSQFIIKMKTYLLANPQIAAAMYWDQRGNRACNFSVAGNAASLTALTALGQVLNGHVAR